MNIIILDLVVKYIIAINLVCHSRRTPKQLNIVPKKCWLNQKDHAIKVWSAFFQQNLRSPQNSFWPLAKWGSALYLFLGLPPLPLEGAKRQVTEVHLNKSASLADQAQLSCRPRRMGTWRMGSHLASGYLRGLNYELLIARLAPPRELN